MKHIRLFESFEDIDSICRKYGIENYTINPDGSVDVDGDVNLNSQRFTKLPLKFGRVSGHFNCGVNKLTTLEGAPREVGRGFSCSYNKLTTLEGAPREVGGVFYCGKNQLTTLEGAPREVGDVFDCGFNPIHAIYRLFNSDGRGHKDFMDSLDWDYIRKDKETNQDQIVMSRFVDACEEAGIKIPKSIKGYKYI